MKIRAGAAFHHRKPPQAPAIAAEKTARSSGFTRWYTSGFLNAQYAITVNAIAPGYILTESNLANASMGAAMRELAGQMGVSDVQELVGQADRLVQVSHHAEIDLDGLLTPTRELALQVEESVRTYGKHIPLRSTTIFGGVNINPQTKALRAGCEIVVATPGRLLDHQGQGNLNFSNLDLLVLDEADRMLDMGFWPDVQRIFTALPPTRQTLLFSATMPGEVLKQVHAPIGLDIGAVTPQEIAVSILAELIAVKHGKMKSRDVVELSMQWNNAKV